MSTASLIVEILVIGIQAGVGIAFWVVGVLGFGAIHKPLSLLDQHGGAWRWLPLLAVLSAVICYTLGIFVDRIALFVFHKGIRPLLHALCPPFLKSWAREKVHQAAEEEHGLIALLYREGALSHLLQDYRSRLRIARATFVNTMLIWTAFWLTPNLSALLPRYAHAMPFMTAVGVLFLGVWVIVLGMLQVTYQERIRQAQEHLSRK